MGPKTALKKSTASSPKKTVTVKKATTATTTSHPTNTNHTKSTTTTAMWSGSKGKKNKKSNGSNSRNHHVMGYSDARAEALFNEIADTDDPTTINMEGIFTLGQKLGMDATEDIRILVLLWKMECSAAKPGEISKAEWMKGCQALQIDTWDKMKAFQPALDTGFLDTKEFKDFYKFCFHFNRQGTHRSLDKDVVVVLLPMVLQGTQRVPTDRLESFVEFLSQHSITHITADQWVSFLDFCHEVTDLSSYDESTSAWPVLMDEYVDYMIALKKKKTNG